MLNLELEMLGFCISPISGELFPTYSPVSPLLFDGYGNDKWQ